MLPRRNYYLRGLTALLLVFSAPDWMAGGQGQAPVSPFQPYQHRALYLYNFAKFTGWPADAFPAHSSPLIVGILGEDPFGKAIDIVRGKPVEGRRLVVKYFPDIDSIEACHLLFICESERQLWPEIFKAVGRSSILTVAESEGFLEAGGMINLLMEKKTLGFEINQAEAEKAGLKIDSRLLRLAKRVKP